MQISAVIRQPVASVGGEGLHKGVGGKLAFSRYYDEILDFARRSHPQNCRDRQKYPPLFRPVAPYSLCRRATFSQSG
ncbi:hypothetical protein [Laspinema palackyanum]|uniref:hypothetical protein n=1 Tax=Laspinema palackyanum TaxID=3231601 RepID=UPI00345DDD00|nr:hypothetical protein [Laspinema sp. D2c]